MKNTILITNKQLRTRAMKLKKKIKDLAKLTNKKIVLIGHGGMFAFITATDFRQDDMPVLPR